MKMFSTTYNEKEKLWCGRDIPSLYNPLISLAQPLLNSMNIFGSKIAQVIVRSFVPVKLELIPKNYFLQ